MFKGNKGKSNPPPPPPLGAGRPSLVYKRHVVFSSKDLFVSENNKKTVSSPAVDFASRKQG